jgi:hypothetical protein
MLRSTASNASYVGSVCVAVQLEVDVAQRRDEIEVPYVSG